MRVTSTNSIPAIPLKLPKSWPNAENLVDVAKRLSLRELVSSSRQTGEPQSH